MNAINAQAIRDAVRRGDMSPEQGAKLLTLHYEIERALRWRAVRQWLVKWFMPWKRR